MWIFKKVPSIFLVPMAVLLIFSFVLTPWAQDMDSEKWFGIVKSAYEEQCKSGTETYHSWVEGTKEEFGLTLKSLESRCELVNIDQNDQVVIVMSLLKITALCYNKDGDKKRAEMVRLVVIAIDKKTEKIIDAKVLDQKGPAVIHGWDGKDV